MVRFLTAALVLLAWPAGADNLFPPLSLMPYPDFRSAIIDAGWRPLGQMIPRGNLSRPSDPPGLDAFPEMNCSIGSSCFAVWAPPDDWGRAGEGEFITFEVVYSTAMPGDGFRVVPKYAWKERAPSGL